MKVWIIFQDNFSKFFQTLLYRKVLRFGNCLQLNSGSMSNYHNFQKLIFFLNWKYMRYFIWYIYFLKFKESLHKRMKFSIKDFFSKYDQISSFLQILLHLLKKSLNENFIFCALNLHYDCSVITNQSHISWLFTKNTKQTKNTLSANFSSYSKDHHFILNGYWNGSFTT